MKPLILGFIVTLTLATPAGALQNIITVSAQQAANCTVTFDQDASSLIAAQAFRYQVQTGASASDIPVTCSGGISPFQCSTPLPNKTIGTYSLTITASEVLTDGTVLTSTPSLILNYRVANAPNAPKNLNIKKS